MLRGAGMRLMAVSGMQYSPLRNRWQESRDTGVNYILAARRD
jgi:2-polyprenyl-3-methyl-5-hydroxy-6-metoxy-1,4-benzoquinol methylase